MEWENVPIDEKIDMFRKVSDDMSTKYRAMLNATTMLGQAKTVIQVQELFMMVDSDKSSKTVYQI